MGVDCGVWSVRCEVLGGGGRMIGCVVWRVLRGILLVVLCRND